MARFYDQYKTEAVPALMKRFGCKNVLSVPKLRKIVVNMGIGRATLEPKRIQAAVKDLTTITGQHPVVTVAKKSVAGFKIRDGNAIGCMVTLRGTRMYEFLDRLISVTIPRIRDFRGLPYDSFDGHGNYTMGLSEQTVFPEIDLDKIEFVQGMDITIVTTATNDEEGRELLLALGLPLRKT